MKTNARPPLPVVLEETRLEVLVYWAGLLANWLEEGFLLIFFWNSITNF